MDRISALRNIEDALRAFERGEADLATTEFKRCLTEVVAALAEVKIKRTAAERAA